MTEHEDHEHEFDLVMPFVLVKSAGGPYDDDAFVSGYRLATIAATIAPSGASWRGYVTPADLPQLDLIAMKEHAKVTRIGGVGDDWVLVEVGP